MLIVEVTPTLELGIWVVYVKRSINFIPERSAWRLQRSYAYTTTYYILY